MTDVLSRLTAAFADRYAVERELGSGGMATVYLAHDVKHDRKVAIKVMRPELSAILGGERFLRKVQIAAKLNHPHILALHDSGEAEEFLYYVMPYVEGESLREKLNREKQLSIDEAISITKQVGAALDYAHEQGVIHRDIKPENILMYQGEALVADFGIALAVSAAGGTRLTDTGLSLGTPEYMSPEQATGERELDARSDVYSLGAITYEMLVGEPPHTGNTVQAIIAKVVSAEPQPVSRVRHTVPNNVDAAVMGALAKVPADRFESGADFAGALTNPAFALPSVSGQFASAMPSNGVWKRAALGFAATASLLAIVLLWGWLRPDPPLPVTWRGLAFPTGQEPMTPFGSVKPFAFAPDGSWYVYVGPGTAATQLWIKRRGVYEATPVAGTEGAKGPAVSPDGQSIVFTVDGVLRRVLVSGGQSVVLSDSANTGAPTAAWLDDGTVVFNDNQWQLRAVASTGGASPVISEPLRDSGAVGGILTVGKLPSSRAVLIGLCDANCSSVQEVWALDLRTGESKRVLANAVAAEYVPSGHLIAGRYRTEQGLNLSSGVFAVAFDLETLETSGDARNLFEDVSAWAMSKSGTLLMESFGGVGQMLSEAVWVDRNGSVTPIDTTWRFEVGGVTGNYGWLLSPDGSKLAIGLTGGGQGDIWIKELDDGPRSRLTFAESYKTRPRWTPDGRSVMYIGFEATSMIGGIHTIRADGTGSAELVYADRFALAVTVSGTDDWLLIRTGNLQRFDIVGFRPGLDSTAIPLLTGEYDELAPALSSDGRWLAYTSNESGQRQVYVRPFPNVDDGKWPVSLRGGYAPLWAHSGRELFYISPDNEMIAAAVQTEPEFDVTEHRVLFELGPEFVIDLDHTAHDISPDDRRFIMVRRVGSPENPEPQYVIIDNFFELLKQRVGNGND